MSALLSILLLVTTLVTDAPSTEVYVSGNYEQSTYAIEGDRAGGFSVEAQSVYDIDSVHRVFGEASYNWRQSHGNRFVENADYEMLSPYLTVDTVGGGMRTETYFFRGGYRMMREHIVWHAALQFRALQSYRDVDPRPKNKVADLRVDAGIGYTDNRYAYMAIAEIGRYKQNNEIKFYSELGESQIYHMVAPGAAYTRFSGSKKESYYHGLTAGATLAMMPRSEGWLAELDYNYLNVTKELHDNTYIALGCIRTNAWDATVGYVASGWQVTAQGGMTMRRGLQFIYGEAVNNTYTLLARQANFAEDGWHIGAEGSYECDLPVGSLQVSGGIVYDTSNAEALPAEARWQELSDLLTEDTVEPNVTIQYTFPVGKKFSWFVRPVGTFCYYINTTRHTWQAALQTGLTF